MRNDESLEKLHLTHLKSSDEIDMLYNNIMNFLMVKVPFLILVFLFSQTAGIVHAEVHAFHEHDEVCDAFELVSNQSADLVDKALQTKVDFNAIQVSTSFSNDLSLSFRTVYFSRAPPLFSLI